MHVYASASRMKAIVTAGGRGTRLRPITWTLNKHLIPLAGEPMLFNAFKKIAALGITEVAVNINPGDQEIARVCGDGSRWGLRLTYVEQEGGSCGVGQIIYSARAFVGDEDVLLYFGDNIILGSLRPFVEKFTREQLDCCLALARVPDPERFGVPELHEGRLVGVEEKPQHPKSPFAVTGIYLYRASAYFNAFSHTRPSARGEYEISDVHDWLIKNGDAVGYQEITGWWKDTGKPRDLLIGNQLLLNELSFEDAVVHPSVILDSAVRLEGRVKIEAGTVLSGATVVRGPVVIGAGAQITDSFVGPHTSVGGRVKLTGAEIEHSILMEGAEVSAGGRITDSIIGADARVLSSENGEWPSGRKLLVGESSVLEL